MNDLSPGPAVENADQHELRTTLRAAAIAPPTDIAGRLLWIGRTALATWRYPWIWLLMVGYVLAAGLVWGTLLFFMSFVTLLGSQLSALAGDTTTASVLVLLFLAGAFISAGLLAAGYNGGLIRMLAPLIAGQPPDAMRFVSGAMTLGPRLFLVFCVAVLLASIPIWLLTRFFWDLLRDFGWGVLTSPWNPTLQWWVLAEIAGRMLGIAITITAMNLLLGPWQALVGTQRVHLLAALPLTVGRLVREFPVSVVVLGLIGLLQWGFREWSASAPMAASMVQLLVTPTCWMALLCLMAPDYVAESPSPTQRRMKSPVAVNRTQPVPQADVTNPIPGLLPHGQ